MVTKVCKMDSICCGVVGWYGCGMGVGCEMMIWCDVGCDFFAWGVVNIKRDGEGGAFANAKYASRIVAVLLV